MAISPLKPMIRSESLYEKTSEYSSLVGSKRGLEYFPSSGQSTNENL